MDRRAVAAAALSLAVGGVLLTTGADARVEVESAYTKQQIYSGALRYLRVDLGWEVTEKDPDAAYLLFMYTPHGTKRQNQGSIEIVDRAESARILVSLPQMPRYREQMLSDGLMTKLKQEYGEPPRREKPEPPPTDAGAKD